MSILKDKISKFPSEPGIYLFFNKNGELIYVGKATNLRARVRSYFAGARTLRPIEQMIHEVAYIKIKQTDSVLEAIILEANTIKKFKPKYNIDLKDDKSWNYIVVTKDSYPKVQTVRAHELASHKPEAIIYKYLFGPYPGLNTKATMRLLQRLFFISMCKTPVKRNKVGDTSTRPSSPSSRSGLAQDDVRPCLYRQMRQCLGVCTGEISPAEYKRKVIGPLVKFLRGNKKGLIRDLEKKMNEESKKENFEEAARLRNQIKALERIHDIALLNRNFVETHRGASPEYTIRRIEGYDISNLGDQGKVGSMVVFENGEASKSEYRKFKIKNVVGQSDVDCLAEVLERRLKHVKKDTDDADAYADDTDHADKYFWPKPDVILVDGGVSQVNKVHQVLKLKSYKVPVIGIAKGMDRKKNEFIYVRNSKNTKLRKEEKEFVKWVEQNKDLLVEVRDEAHRFAIKYQRVLRKIKH